jgi:DNA polymerase-1
MECRLLPVLVAMRMQGVSVDLDAAEQAHEAINGEIAALQKRIDELAGRPVHTKSPKDMEILFKALGIKPIRTDGGQVCLAAHALNAIRHPVGKLVVEIEELKKYNSTFIESYILDSEINGKIYGEFDPFGAKTGRFSSKQPNLQNIPSRNELAKRVRRIFIPDDGHPWWRKYDYASIENRIFAHYAVGKAGKLLRQQYIDDPFTDYHNWCLDLMAPVAGWDVSTEEKYKAKRKPIKNINFGIVYGMGVDKLAVDLKISKQDATALMEKYHEALPHVKDTMDFLSEQANDIGYSETILGRKVMFDKWEPIEYSRDPFPALPRKQALAAYGFGIKKAGLYKATNYTIQGTAADLMKMAMVQCWEQGIFDETGVPRMTVHDELDFSDEGGNDEAFVEMARVMETAIPLSVPVIVDGEIGRNWSDLKDIERAA